MSKMAHHRNTSANHAIRYPFFERVEGEFHEQRLITGGSTGNWLDAETRQAMVAAENARVSSEEIALTPLVNDHQRVARTHPRYLARDPVVPAGTYRVETVGHHFSYAGELLPSPAANEAVLYHGGACVEQGRGGDPVAVVKFSQNLIEMPDPYQRAVFQDERTGQWHAPESPEHLSLMKGYIDLMTEIVHKPLMTGNNA
jgi:hypothetical protein